jgi:hypothetical protein
MSGQYVEGREADANLVDINGEKSNCNWLGSLRKNVVMSHKVLIGNTRLNED